MGWFYGVSILIFLWLSGISFGLMASGVLEKITFIDRFFRIVGGAALFSFFIRFISETIIYDWILDKSCPADISKNSRSAYFD